MTVRLLTTTALAAALTLLPALPAAAGPISGTVRLAGPPPAARKLPVTIDQYICGKEVDDEQLVVSPDRGIKNAVVYVKTPPAGATASLPATVQMDQQQCVFVPRVVVVPVGGTVEFLNSDRLLHNVHSLSRGNPSFNRTQPRGRTIPMTFKAPEIVRISCDLHAWMRGWVVVAEHGFYAVTDEQGRFTLPDLPPGKYTLAVWHESLGTTTVDATATGAPSTITIDLAPKKS
jgi:plastocyanin